MGSSITLKEATSQYIQHLTETGQKPSTVGTARRTLDLLIAEMGEGKEVGKILTLHVAGLFKSEAATTLKGKPRAEASVLQIRRVVRAALVWWHEQGWSDGLPLPKTEQHFVEGSQTKKAAGPEPAVATSEATSTSASEATSTSAPEPEFETANPSVTE